MRAAAWRARSAPPCARWSCSTNTTFRTDRTRRSAAGRCRSCAASSTRSPAAARKARREQRDALERLRGRPRGARHRGRRRDQRMPVAADRAVQRRQRPRHDDRGYLDVQPRDPLLARPADQRAVGTVPRLLLRGRLPRRLHVDVDGAVRPSRQQSVLPLPRAGTVEARLARARGEDAGSAGDAVRPGPLRPDHRAARRRRRLAQHCRAAAVGDERAGAPRHGPRAALAQRLLRLPAIRARGDGDVPALRRERAAVRASKARARRRHPHAAPAPRQSVVVFTRRTLAASHGSMKKLLLLLTPLLLAQAPAFLQHTLLPAQFTAAFTTYQKGEINPPARVLDNKVFYLETPDGTRYFKSFFAQSALLPGAPPRFKNTSVWWFVERDPAHGNQYTARVFSVQLKEWALMAVNLVSPRRNLVERYYQHFTVPPATMICDTPDRRPPPGPALWFYTSGHNPPSGPPPLPQADQGYFGMLTTPVTGPDHQLYNPPYSIIGGGSGVLHQAYRSEEHT